ncbi:MAG: adenylate/guanylate cyclase domain-containing protein [Rhizobiaceae bacterium]
MTGESENDRSQKGQVRDEGLLEVALRDILQTINLSRDDEQPVFDVIIKYASQMCDAPLAALGIISEDRKHYHFKAGLGAKPDFVKFIQANPPELDPERYVAARAMVEMRTIHVDDLADPSLYGASDSVRAQSVALEGVRSSFYVPLILGETSIGGIFLYRRVVSPFSQNDIALAEMFAEYAVIAVENVRQYKALQATTREVQLLNADLENRVEQQVGEIERISRLKRFLPPAVADAVVSEGDEKLLRSHRALIATVFADIRGFTTFCESAEPEETIDVLQTYHEAMGNLLGEHGAGVDQRAGDGIMAIFNDPLPCDDPAGDAVRMALAMRDYMKQQCLAWKRMGHQLGFGLGISFGYATVGMVGSEGRYEYTASGTTVNVAARLCDEAKDGEILLSPRAFAAVDGDFDIKPYGELMLKGIKAPVVVSQVMGV